MILKIADWQFRVDPVKTRERTKKYSTDHCTCGYCSNYYDTVEEALKDNYVPLDTKLMFSNDNPKREDYSSKSLPYALEQGDISAYDELMEKFLMGEELTTEEVVDAVRAATLACTMTPVLCGTSYRNKGVQLLLDAIEDGNKATYETVPFEVCKRESIRKI